MRFLKHLTYLMMPLRVASIASIAYSTIIFCQGIIPAIETIVLAEIIDNLELNKVRTVFFVYIYIILIFIDWIVPTIKKQIEIPIKNKLRIVSKNLYFDKINNLPYSTVEDKRTQDLWIRISEREDAFFDGFCNFMNILQIFTQVLSSCYIVSLYSPQTAGITLIMMVAIILINNKFSKRKYENHIKNSFEKRFVNYLSNILTEVKYSKERFLFGFEKKSNEAYEKKYDEILKKETDIELFRCLSTKVGGTLFTIFFVVVVLIIIYDGANNLTFGIFIAICKRMISLVDLLSNQTSNAIYTFFNDMLYYEDVHAFLRLKEKKSNKNNTHMRITEISKIEFINVSFTYPGTKNKVLNNLTFTMYKGKRYAFVGENGSGKTTIVKLLCGLYTNYTGQILINDIPLQEINRKNLNNLISVCFQDFICYDMSIDENIGLEKNGNDNEKLNEILRSIGLYNRISRLPEKGDSHIGKIFKDGIDFSGGERQKIALARCLFKDAQINILDEPTSALDPKFESKFIDIIESLSNDNINLIISHRLGCTKKVDMIFVLNNGHIAECGNYHDLIKKRGEYYEMYQKQSQWYKDKNK